MYTKRDVADSTNKQPIEATNAPTINYTWIGPPPSSSQSGHDTNGPRNMAAKNKTNPIKFWCLQEYVSHYQAEFKGLPIEVCSIEKMVEEKEQDPKKQAAKDQFNQILNKVLKDPERDKKRKNLCEDKELAEQMYIRCLKRDLVTIKNAFSLLLLRLRGDYVMDTNVEPYENANTVSLPAYETFKYPLVGNHTDNIQADVWMLYQPTKQRSDNMESAFNNYFKKSKEQDIESAFNDYFNNWKKQEEEEFNKKGYSQHYHDWMGGIFVSAVQGFSRRFVWPVKYLEEHNRVLIEELNLVKTYQNTHKKLSSLQLLNEGNSSQGRPSYQFQCYREAVLHYQDTSQGGYILEDCVNSMMTVFAQLEKQFLEQKQEDNLRKLYKDMAAPLELIPSQLHTKETLNFIDKHMFEEFILEKMRYAVKFAGYGNPISERSQRFITNFLYRFKGKNTEFIKKYAELLDSYLSLTKPQNWTAEFPVSYGKLMTRLEPAEREELMKWMEQLTHLPKLSSGKTIVSSGAAVFASTAGTKDAIEPPKDQPDVSKKM